VQWRAADHARLMPTRLAGLTWLLLSVALPVLLAAWLADPRRPDAHQAPRPGFTGSAACAGCHAE
jgi:hypothetical protein